MDRGFNGSCRRAPWLFRIVGPRFRISQRKGHPAGKGSLTLPSRDPPPAFAQTAAVEFTRHYAAGG